MTPAAADGPVLLYVIVPLTVEPAVADAGTAIDVMTSASGDIAVVSDALSGCVFGVWLVVVPIVLVALTAPEAGALKLTAMVTDAPATSVAGMPVKVTPPVTGSYVALAPPGAR